MVFAMQLLSGQNLCGQGVQFLTSAGLNVNTVFSLNVSKVPDCRGPVSVHLR